MGVSTIVNLVAFAVMGAAGYWVCASTAQARVEARWAGPRERTVLWATWAGTTVVAVAVATLAALAAT